MAGVEVGCGSGAYGPGFDPYGVPCGPQAKKPVAQVAAPPPSAAPQAAAATIAQGIGGMGGPAAAPMTGPQVGADPAISMQGLATAAGSSAPQPTPSVISAPGGLRQGIGTRIYPDGSKKLRSGMY